MGEGRLVMEAARAAGEVMEEYMAAVAMAEMAVAAERAAAEKAAAKLVEVALVVVGREMGALVEAATGSEALDGAKVGAAVAEGNLLGQLVV